MADPMFVLGLRCQLETCKHERDALASENLKMAAERVFIMGGDIPETIERTRLVLVDRANKAEAALATVTAELTEARSARERAEQALRGLADKLDAMEKPVNACLGISHVHGFPYAGPTWEHELKAARAALTPPVPPSATSDEVKE